MSTDVTINGVGYMVMPGSYKADSAIVTSSTSGTAGTAAELPASQREGRAIATTLASRGAVPGGLGGLLPSVGPNYRPRFPIAEAGIGPPPIKASRSGSIGSTTNRKHVASNDKGYIASGSNLYGYTTGGTSTEKSSMGASATDLAIRFDDEVFVAFGGSQDVASWDDSSNTWTTSILGASEQATLITMYKDRPLTVPDGSPTVVRLFSSALSASTDYELNGTVLDMHPIGDGVLIATSQSWYLLDNTPELIPVHRPTQQARAVYLTTYNGSVYASVDGYLYRRSGFAGTWTKVDAPGAVGDVVASVDWMFCEVTTYYGASGWWATDGETWFLLNTDLDQLWRTWDDHVVGVIDNDTDLYDLDEDPDGAGDQATSYQAATTLQGATIARDKNWTKIGAEFQRYDGETVGSWSAQLQYSTDGGRTWTNAGSSQTVDDEAERITADISGSGVTGRMLMVRVNVSATSGLAPILVALWADWDVTDDDGGAEGTAGTSGSTTRTHVRRWRFKIPAQDGLVNRNGAALGLSASTIRSNLWARLNQTSSFTDLDGTVHATTTLTDIEEAWPSPADQPLNVSTMMELTILEGDQTV